MSIPRELYYENLAMLHSSAAASQLARYALKLSYDKLPEDVIHQAKRSLLDALGCAIGGHSAPARAIMEEYIQETGGREEATVIGSGARVPAMNAALINSLMVRYLDYNDEGGGGHNSDSIPALLAVAEREHKNGAELISAIVASYELGARVIEAIDHEGKGLSLQKRGYSMDTRGCISMPGAIGLLMGLSEEQIANATGICACGSIQLNIIDCDKEEFNMVKNIRFGKVAYDAILACQLAKKGFTGPPRVIEGDCGVNEVLLENSMSLEKLTDFSGWRMLKTRHKKLCACGAVHSQLYAVQEIVQANDLKPDDIKSVRVMFAPRVVDHIGGYNKKYPRNAETADHSIYFTAAYMIKHRDLGPESCEEENFTDPEILELVEKIAVVSDDTFEAYRRGGAAVIETNDGRHFEKTVCVPHGYAEDPLSDEEIENKFMDMALERMSREQAEKIMAMVWKIENIDDVGQLMELLVF